MRVWSISALERPQAQAHRVWHHVSLHHCKGLGKQRVVGLPQHDCDLITCQNALQIERGRETLRWPRNSVVFLDAPAPLLGPSPSPSFIA